jgi:tetratricopeptide (TPR) repeat protein
MWILSQRFINFLGLSLALFFGAGCTGQDESHRWLLAEQYVKAGNYRRGIDEYTRIVNSSSNSTRSIRAQMEIANIFGSHLKDFPKAIASYRKASESSKEASIKIQAHLEISKIYSEKLEDPSSAAKELETLFDSIAQFQKEGPDVLLLCAKNLMDAGKFDSAAKKYASFRTLFPGHKEGPRTLFDEAQAHLAARNLDSAKVLFNETISKFSESIEYSALVGEAYYGLGNAHEAAGDLSTALESYQKSLALYPNKKVIELKIERVLKRQKEKQI